MNTSWLEIDLNVAEIITVQDYKHDIYNVKAKSQVPNT